MAGALDFKEPLEDRQGIWAGEFERGDVLAGKYRIEGLLGRGGAGSVYRASTIGDDENPSAIAVKLIRSDWSASRAARCSFRNEAMLWIAMKPHPFVVSAYSAETHAGRLFVTMDYVPPSASGRTHLGQYLGDDIDFERKCEWAIQACRAMEHVHGEGIAVHQDIKPQNLLIRDGIVALTDFGLAVPAHALRFRREDASDAWIRSQLICGTPGYIAPEVLTGNAADERSDVYSLGVVLWQLASDSAVPPFRTSQPRAPGLAVREIVNLQLARDHAPVSGPFASVVRRALDPDPERRWSGFAEIRSALEELSTVRVPVPAMPESRVFSLTNRTAALSHLGKLDEAIDLCDELLAMSPRSQEAMNNKGVSLMALGRHEEALACFDDALNGTSTGRFRMQGSTSQEPDYVSVNRAGALLALGRIRDAIFSCRRALDINPRCAWAWGLQGIASEARGDHERALDCHRRAHEIDKHTIEFWTGIVSALRNLQRMDEARATVRELLAVADAASAEAFASRLREFGESEAAGWVNQAGTTIQQPDQDALNRHDTERGR